MISISFGINQVSLYQLKVKYAVYDITRHSTFKFYFKEVWSVNPVFAFVCQIEPNGRLFWKQLRTIGFLPSWRIPWTAEGCDITRHSTFKFYFKEVWSVNLVFAFVCQIEPNGRLFWTRLRTIGFLSSWRIPWTAEGYDTTRHSTFKFYLKKYGLWIWFSLLCVR